MTPTGPSTSHGAPARALATDNQGPPSPPTLEAPREAPTSPSRYAVLDGPAGRVLVCRDAPEVRVRIVRGLTVTAAAARKAPEGTIFVDGAAQGGPFLDAERRVFNLDHHDGCVRSFTLASCEQALVLVLRGLDLGERSFTIHANDPDLDTIVAIWVLLNGPHLTPADSPLRAAAIPLVRLEGILDVHGPERVALAGLPPELLRDTSERLAELRRGELEVRRAGNWDESDPLTFAARQLDTLDRLLYPPAYFAGYRHVEVLARADLGEQRLAVVCRSADGIYEAESELRRLYGRRLGLIALQKDAATYTLRQVDPFLPAALDAVYARLNALDPAVRSPRHADRWGGSAEIGGSPRQRGTALAPHEIADACRAALYRPRPSERLRALGAGAGLAAVGAVPFALTAVTALLTRSAPLPATPSPPVVLPEGTLGAAFLAAAQTASGLVAVCLGLGLLLLAFAGARWPRRLGLRLPVGWDWLFTLPVALLGGLAGGAWVVPAPAGAETLLPVHPLGLAAWGLALALPFAAELLLRGLVHERVARGFATMSAGGSWFLSVPTLAQALFAALLVPLMAATVGRAITLGDLPLLVTAAFATALGTGVARERAGSLVASYLLHLAAAAAWYTSAWALAQL